MGTIPKLGGGLLGGAENDSLKGIKGLSGLPLTVLEKANEERSVSLHLPELASTIQTSCPTTPITTTGHRLPARWRSCPSPSPRTTCRSPPPCSPSPPLPPPASPRIPPPPTSCQLLWQTILWTRGTKII